MENLLDKKTEEGCLLGNSIYDRAGNFERVAEKDPLQFVNNDWKEMLGTSEEFAHGQEEMDREQEELEQEDNEAEEIEDQEFRHGEEKERSEE